MLLDYADNTVQLLANIAALLICLFQYISRNRRGWIYATVVFLCSLMSSYYWTAYLLIMGDSPSLSNLFSYTGWNMSYAVLLMLILHMKQPEERRYFHPAMLLPVPLNLWQLSFYLPYGGELNSIYQVAVMTAVACFSLQGICWYLKNRKSGAPKPCVAAAGLLYTFAEFGMWTSTSVEWPVEGLYNLYYVFSFLFSAGFLVLVWAIARAYGSRPAKPGGSVDARYQTILKASYFAVMVICCVGGIALGLWMKNVMAANMEPGPESGVYNIIPVVLFVISLFVVAFAVAVIFVVNFSEKAAENNRLREARAIAEHSSAAKSEFLANMSHEIRTPINAVLGMNEMILRESLRARDLLPEDRGVIRGIFSDIGNYAGNIRSAGNSLLSITNDILDISRIEAGRLEIVEANYKLSSVLNDVSNMIVFKARDKGLAFSVDVDGSLPDGLCGDEVRVRQIVTNVLNNAVKYTKEGSVRFAIRGEAGVQPAAGETIVLTITVTDTGVGIRQEDVGKLFRKFERVDLQANSTVEGTGLGLAITRNLLDMMGGSIEVQSVYGEGSTFTVTLPQKVVSTEPVGDFEEKFRRSLRETPAYRESFRAPAARVLIVDDTRMNLTVAVSLLRNTEIQIDTAVSGAEAVLLCASIRYDLILMDQRMPEMDGTEAMRRIREQPDGANRETPFICLTADAVSGARERYLAAGFADYLTKPIDSLTLEQMLEKLLPPEKVERVQARGDSAQAGGTAGAGDYAEALRALGIDPRAGLRYCRNDEALYRSMLEEYVLGAAGKLDSLRASCGRENWKEYATAVHALKSTSGMIGAAALSEAAAGLEAAADAGDGAAVREGHERFCEDCAGLCDGIRALLGLGEGQAGASGDDGEILEFLPEE